jgi:hypothetical protein
MNLGGVLAAISRASASRSSSVLRFGGVDETGFVSRCYLAGKLYSVTHTDMLYSSELDPATSRLHRIVMSIARATNLASLIGATLVIFGCCFVHEAVAGGRRHSGHPMIGWGWDSRSGWYAGPIFGRAGHGYFRCFDPGYGWHRCPHYLPVDAAPKAPRQWWRWHYMGTPPV